MWHLLLFAIVVAAEETADTDGENSRKILGSSVVTSVSVIMDSGNGSKMYADAVGKPVSKPVTAADVASPIELLNPDRYEFYTFDDTGELVRRLMTLEEIREIIATSDGDLLDDSLSSGLLPEKRVNDVVNNVQNVLKEEMKVHKDPENKPQLDTPDVSETWSMILPAIFGNSGEVIKPEPSFAHVTPDTIMIEPTKKTSQKPAMVNVEIISSSKSTTEKTNEGNDGNSQIIEIKPLYNDLELTKDNSRPIYHVANRRTTRRPVQTKPTDVQGASSAVLEKIVPLTTTTSTTTPKTTTTTTTQTTTTTTTENPTTTTTPEETTTIITTTLTPEEEKTESTTAESTTSESSTKQLPTLFEILNKSPAAEASTIASPETTFTPLSTFFIVNETTTEDDLSTLSTEQITTKSVNTSPSGLLDQFLLTSTNIYEINTQLAGKIEQTTSDNITTERQSETTTDQALVESIEQLISQAIGTIEPPLDTNKDATKIHEMMQNSGNKTLQEVLLETATVASNLVGDYESTTETTTYSSLLSESMDSLLSQIAGIGATTVEDYSTTNSPVETTENFTELPHIINITIIKSNQSKPAKADTSLEVDYEDVVELNGNSTFEEASSTEINEISTTFETTTDFITTTNEPVEKNPVVVLTISENNTSDDSNWTLVSTLVPSTETTTIISIDINTPVDLVPKPLQGFGLEDSTALLDSDIYQFVQLCNELAFGFWKSITNGLSSARSVVVSPFAATSLLAMVFLGARGATSGEMNEILKLDNMVTFNPHLIFKNVSESIQLGQETGVAVSAITRELFSDRSKGKLLGFYKERVRQFYDGLVEEASFREIADVVRRRTNLLVKKNTNGKISEFLRDSSIFPKPPLAGISTSIFETDCSHASTSGRDGELHFVVSPTIRQRRLIPIPAVVYRSNFLAGYEPSLDATAAALGTKEQTVSTIFIIPGQQGIAAPGDGLIRLEKRLTESSFKKGAWARLLRSLIPRPGLELQIPRFLHRSVINATQALKKMGLHELFDAHKADLKGLNGAAHELHLSDVIQVNEFATCGEGQIKDTHHKEIYPASTDRKNRKLEASWEDYQRAFHDPLHDPTQLNLPLSLRPRQARVPEVPRLRFDRPFLYIIRHNPSGLILHMGRFHPRLLP